MLQKQGGTVTAEEATAGATSGQVMLSGDWICGKCGNNNFAKRMFCNIPTCRAPKHESAIIVPGEQRGGFGNDQGGFDYNAGGGGTEGNFGYGGANFGKSGAGPPPPSLPSIVIVPLLPINTHGGMPHLKIVAQLHDSLVRRAR